MAGPAAGVLLLAAVVLQSSPVHGKVEVGSLRFSMTGAETINWHYLGKFGYGLGTGTYDLRARYRDLRLAAAGAADESNLSMEMDVELVLDDRWEGALAKRACSSQRAALTHRTRPIRVTKEWTHVLGGKLQQSMRPHIWYFALSRCGRGFNTTIAVDYELRLVQSDGTELSEEARLLFLAAPAVVACLSLLLARFGWQCWALWRRVGEVHPVIRGLVAAAALQWLGQAAQLLHLRFFEATGASESGAEAIADILSMLSQVVCSCLLIVIARGYTLLSAKEADFAVAKPVATAIVALLHVALVGLGKLQGDSHDKLHENGGSVGLALVAARLLLCTWFLVCVQELLRQHHERVELCNFLRPFRRAGCLYFLSYPAIFVLGKAFAQYLQHPVMHLGLVVMQAAATLWLSELLLSTSSLYNQVSTLRVALLPPAGGSPTTSSYGSPESSGSVYGSPHFGVWSHEKKS